MANADIAETMRIEPGLHVPPEYEQDVIKSEHRWHKTNQHGIDLLIVGIALKKAREQKGYTMRAIAPQVGVSSSSISRIERGDTRNIWSIARYAVVLGLHIRLSTT